MTGSDDPSAEDVHAGQAVYTKPMLAVYDLAVLGFNCRFLWRCPSRDILALYNESVSTNHLDVGVGTGYFLDRCRFPDPRPRLALLDLNPNCLEVTARRLARYAPEAYRANVLAPVRIEAPGFDSVGMSFLLHCLPGTIRTKAVAFDHLKALLNPGGVIFGATLLGRGDDPGPVARRAMRFFNARKVFSNEHDDLTGLREELAGRFPETSVRVVGSVALFRARAP
jgi:SAM-dependent methyltransferase